LQTFSFRKLVQIIREEFEGAPDLSISVSEAARFFGLDLPTCERVLTELLRAGFLAQGADARYRQTTATLVGCAVGGR
jgi:DNA-binding IclR family transcriptional regulator